MPRRMKRPGFKLYLFIIVSVLAAVPVGGLSLWESARWRRFRGDQADAQGLRVAQSLSRELTQRLDASVRVVEALARQVEARGTRDPAVLQTMVRASHGALPGVAVLGVATREGLPLAVVPEKDAEGKHATYKVFREEDSFKELLRTSATVVSEPFLSKVFKRPIVAIATPIRGPAPNFDAYAFASFDLGEVQKLAEQVMSESVAKRPDQAMGESPVKVYILDHLGRAVAHPDAQAPQELKDLSALDAFRAANGNSILRDGLDDKGTRVRTAAVDFTAHHLTWTVVVAWDESTLHVEAGTAQRAGLLAALLALLIAVLAAVPMAGWLMRPISRIAKAAAAVGGGDLTQRLDEASWWEPLETQVLMTSFRSMLDQLRELLRSLRSSKEEMLKTVGGLSQMMRAQTTLMERQTINLTELSTSARVVQEVSALSASRAEEVLVRAANADELSVAGQQSVERSLRGLQEIRNQTEAIVGTIATLLERTLEIGEITERVKDLADQSNVVAFNAAIQAMRAGEWGRGFDVVAAEMRSLANRSIESTVRIREILGNAEKAIRSTAATSEEGGRKISHGMEQIQESGNRLRELSVIVEVNSVGTKEIASAVKQQYSGILEISRALDSLEEAMKDTAVVFESAEKVANGLLAASERISTQVDAFRVE